MRPALSVIFFTVVSGSGYGLLFLLGLGLALDPQVATHARILLILSAGAVFAAAGLTSSLLHLGQPQRAWRALSQWRSSWLSREGVVAFASFVPIIAIGIGVLNDIDSVALRTFGAALAVLSALTVYCTSGIYTSLKTVHAWHNAYVLPGYLLLGLLGGASWLWAIDAFTQLDSHGMPRFVLPGLISTLALASALLKRAYWRYIDATRHPSTIESATGLGRFGAVRSVEAPHTEENYLTHEMGFALARKHASRLRTICIVLVGALPIVFAVTAPVVASPPLAVVVSCATAACVVAGLFVERWLFFAQAKHVVMLYYDSSPAARRA